VRSEADALWRDWPDRAKKGDDGRSFVDAGFIQRLIIQVQGAHFMGRESAGEPVGRKVF
jgi:hypothetical protein